MGRIIKNRGILAAIIIGISILCIFVCIFVSQTEYEEQNCADITWIKNEDDSYTFTNNTGTENSTYAWYVLDETKEAVFKTKYSDSPNFIYDLEGNKDLTIKGFVRTGEDKTSMFVATSDVLGLVECPLTATKVSKENVILIKKQILSPFSAEEISFEALQKRREDEWGVSLAIPVEWKCSNIVNRSVGVQVNGLAFLDEAYTQYFNTKDKKYANIIKEYMIDWIEQNPEYDEENEWCWHDDATAYRVMRMSVYYYDIKRLCSWKERKLIEKSLRYQAELLASNEFYTKKHNHGMHQDIALLIEALLIEKKRDVKEEHLSIALGRMAEYLEYVYTDDGIHKEHSPLYAKDTLEDIYWLCDVTEDISPEFSARIGRYVDGASEYLIQIIKPDGTWPSIGDSAKVNGIETSRGILENHSEYRWIVSDGLEGEAPEIAHVFPQGGYGVFRSSWERENATWMMLVASTFSSTHKHGDDLEVLLYHKGDLFVEGGKRNYNYLDEMTAWAYSGYAHNVLLVNEEAYPVKVGKTGFQSIESEALETGITEYNTTSATLSVTGKEYRFDGIEQERTLSYDRPNNIVTITDVLEAERDFKGTLLYHIAEGVEVSENAAGWNLYRDKKLVAVISVEGERKFELRTILAEDEEYPYCTWIFEGEEEPRCGSLLMIDVYGQSGRNKVDMVVEMK